MQEKSSGPDCGGDPGLVPATWSGKRHTGLKWSADGWLRGQAIFPSPKPRTTASLSFARTADPGGAQNAARPYPITADFDADARKQAANPNVIIVENFLEQV
jgi:hypothetical protein